MGRGIGGHFSGTVGAGSDSTTISSKLPERGKPNSSLTRIGENGKRITKRIYDSMGRAKEDIDYTDHGNPKTHPKVPHRHTWKWVDDKPIRSKYDE